MILFRCFGLAMLLLMGCKSTEPMLREHPLRIEYGSFGGFAGSYTMYTAVPDGQVWKQDRHQGDHNSMAPIDEAVLQQAVAILRELRKAKYAIHQPGNMTYFVRLFEGQDVDDYELVWGNEDPDPRAKILYQSLVQLAIEQTYTR
ncbi:MAG: hypothetical protein AAFR14_12420 [Bacteroidota bacterium]